MDERSVIEIRPDVLRLIPKRLALELCVLPIASENGTITVALAEGFDQKVLSDIAFLTGKKVLIEIVPRDALLAEIGRHYGVTEAELNKSSNAATSFEDATFKKSDTKIISVGGNGSIVSLVNQIISDAIHMKASDIHVEPYERNVRVRYRLDGVLREVLRPPLETAKALISRLKIMADLDIAEKRRPQDGRIRVKEDDRTVDIRVSTLPTDFGEKVVLRILDKTHLQLNLEKLGFEDADLPVFRKNISLPFGMILVTGPTGSGKTTTLYAALNHINKPEINITTIEDPIEYNLPGINQTHVRSDIGLTFAHALRSILRQDPNVIMLGEIRDVETAEIAIRAALTGHLVLSTLHTNDAPSAITRLTEMGIEPFLVATSVKLILAQRLLRTLCPRCKVPDTPSQEQLKELYSTSDKVQRILFYGPSGCRECHQTGYQGRTAVYEIFPITDSISEMIVSISTALELRKKAQASGMLTLREAAITKVEQGVTSVEEVLRETTI
jgi:type IV pilus assembly protein PilB